MAKVDKKEIRVTYYLNNEEDKKIYNELTKHTQPGRVIKEIVSSAINSKNNNPTDINIEVLKLIEKLADKIEHLNIRESPVQQTKNDINDNQNEVCCEVSLDRDVKVEDLDDIEF